MAKTEANNKDQAEVEIDLDPRIPELKEKTGAFGDTISVLVDGAEAATKLKIGKQLDVDLCEALINFLKVNLDIYAWSHANMIGWTPR